jgi:WD40 repeat protein
MVAAVMAGLLVYGIRDAYPTTRVLQESGLAWVASDQIGSLTLLDGVAGQSVVNVPVAHADGDPLLAGQAGATGFALDQATGQLTRVSGSSYTPLTVGGPPGGEDQSLALLIGTETAFVVDPDQSSVSGYDLATLQQADDSRPFAQGRSDDVAVVSASGRLWVIDQGTGQLSWFTSAASGLGTQTFTPGSATLILADGEPVVVDTGTRRAYLIGPDGFPVARLTLGADTGSGIRVSGAAAQQALVITDSTLGTYQSCTFALGTCGLARHTGFSGDTLGPAVTADGRVFVPDYTTGTVWVLDPGGAARPVHTGVLTSPGSFDLFDRNGLVFYNDPHTSQAGVIAPDGTPEPIVKYSSAAKATTSSPSARSAPTNASTTTPAPRPTTTVPGPVPSGPHSGTPAPKPSPTPSPTPVPSGGTPAYCSPGPATTTPEYTLYDPMSTGVYGVAFTSDSTLAVGDLNSSGYLWDISGSAPYETLTGTSGQGIFGIAYSPADTLLAANALIDPGYSKGSVLLWDMSTGKLVTTMTNPPDLAVGAPVVFSPDGSTLAAADSNGNIYLWSTRTDRLTLTIPDEDSDPDYGIAYSPVTGFLAAANGDGTTYLWNTRQGSLVTSFRDPHSDGVHAVAFSPDGGIMATGDNNGNVYLWNVSTGTLILTLYGVRGGAVHSVAFSSRTGILAATINDTKDNSKDAICVWDTAGKLLSAFRDPGTMCATMLAFSPDGSALAVGDENAHTYIWNVNQLSS